MKLWGYKELTLNWCNVIFSTSGSDPEPEVTRFPITSYMFYEKNISEGDIETKVDTYLLDGVHFMCDAHILLHGKEKSLEGSDASPGQKIKKVE